MSGELKGVPAADAGRCRPLVGVCVLYAGRFSPAPTTTATATRMRLHVEVRLLRGLKITCPASAPAGPISVEQAMERHPRRGTVCPFQDQTVLRRPDRRADPP